MSQNNEMAAMLVSQNSPIGVKLFSYANPFFCSNKFLAFVKNGKNQKISAKLFGIFFLVYFKNSESVQQAVSARVL